MKKTYFLILAVTIVLGVILCSCKTQKEPMPSEPESESVSQPTEPTNETPALTEAPTEPESPKLAINYDLLDDIELTCFELEQKHGKLIGFNTPHGGFAYRYENDYGWYCFSPDSYTVRYIDDPTEYKSDNLPYDENGYYIPILTDEGCSMIDFIDIRDVLLNAPDTVSIAEIEAIDGVTIVSKAHESELGDPYSYYSKFTVDGYENYFLTFYHDDPEAIDLNLHYARILPPPKF